MALNGTLGPDSLAARFDGDLVYGLGGRDVLTNYDPISYEGYNSTYLDGGDDNDQLTSYFDLANAPNIPGSGGDLSAGTPTVFLTQIGGLGNDTLLASVAGQQPTNEEFYEVTTALNLNGGDGIDSITERIAPADWTYTFSTIWGGTGDDSIRVQETGDGTILYSTMLQSIRAGDGNDTVVIDTNGGFWDVTNDVQGQAGDDVISAKAVAGDWDGVTDTTPVNIISGGLGDDIIQATAQGIYDSYWVVGENIINGDAGNDRIEAETWNYNELYGGTGNDVILATLVEEIDTSSDTNNILDGGDGDDFLSATGRVDTGGSLEETGSVLTNRLTGGVGNDTLQASAFVNDHGQGGSARNVFLAGDGNDNLVASLIAGTLGANRLFGQNGNDRLAVHGGTGNLMNGGPGRDVLIADTGTDSFIGGFGNDVFRFNSAASSNPTFRDTVQAGDGAVAFELPGGGVLGDQFDLSKVDANAVALGTQDFVFGNSHAAGHLWAVDVGIRTIIRGNTGGDAAPELEIAILDGIVHASAYTAADFLF